MESINFEQTELKNTGVLYTNEQSKFYHAFKQLNISTVGQLLNDNLMHEAMQHFMKENRIILRTFIEYLKFKYLGVHFQNNDILDKKIIISKPNLHYNLGDLFDDFSSIGLISGYVHDAHEILDEKIKELNDDREKIGTIQNHTSQEYIALKSRIDQQQQELLNLKLIDLLKEIMKERFKPKYRKSVYAPVTFERIRLRIESYEQTKKLEQPITFEESNSKDKLSSQQEYDKLTIYRNQLINLINERDILNAQIRSLEEIVNKLSKANTEGGTNK